MCTIALNQRKANHGWQSAPPSGSSAVVPHGQALVCSFKVRSGHVRRREGTSPAQEKRLSAGSPEAAEEGFDLFFNPISIFNGCVAVTDVVRVVPLLGSPPGFCQHGARDHAPNGA